MPDVIWRSLRRARALLWLAGVVVALAAVGGAAGQNPTRLVPIGAGYEADTLELFAAQAAAFSPDAVVTIRVLPITYHTNADTISKAQRRANLELAQTRADQIAEACAAVAAAGQTCVSTVVDIQIRADALDPARVAQLGPEVDGFYILGGDQTVAMRVVANTPTEEALAAGYANGAAVGGNSAGAAVISRYMIGGYLGDNFAWHGLHQGALDLWYGPDDAATRGLIFGLQEAVIDQHVLERGRTARLLQAMVEKPGDKLAVGFDWGTAGVIDENLVVRDVTGWYAAVALDGETYGAAAGAQYLGSDPAILDIHDVAFHVLPPGPYAYDLAARQPWVDGAPQAAPDISGRTFDALLAPTGAGTLFVSGDLSPATRGAVMAEFVAAANAADGPTIVLSAGPRTRAADGWGRYWRNRLRNMGLDARPTLITLTPGIDQAALAAQLADAGAIFFTGNDAALMAALVAEMRAAGTDAALRDWWQGGGVLLADRAAAAALGAAMSAEATPTSDNVEYQSSDSFLADYVNIQPGLGLLPAVFEPRPLYDYLYGRMVSHVVAAPEWPVVGIERGAALRVSPDAVTVIGDEAALVLDGRYAATLATGDNNAFAATWLLLDTFAPGSALAE
jgi:cyanophycinase